ncbi:MAG: YgiQ family radical SAM protein, partial [Pseudomonadota bacterium]
PNLNTDHREQIELLRKVRAVPGVRHAFIASGLRFDLAMKDLNYLKELITHHVGGHLKIAPEHSDEEVLSYMRKPSFKLFEQFREIFEEYSQDAGKEQYLVPYFISSFPGTTVEKMKILEQWLQQEKWNLQQVQNFIPLPMSLAAAMFWSELDPSGKHKIAIPKNEGERHAQRKALQPYRFRK